MTLQEMTAAELVAELLWRMKAIIEMDAIYEETNWSFAPGDSKHHFDRRKGIESKIPAITAELDSRCEKAGIGRSPNGSFYIQPFDLPLKEAEERAALINYMISKP